jgi:tripartite-type tricarboxylate transporter receptor subunit TctC
MWFNFRNALFLLGFGLSALTSHLAFAQYPNRTIKIVVPYPAGGGSDTISRPLAQKLTAELGQSVIVDNKGGAGGSIAMEYVAKSAPDGYTLILGLTPQLAANVSLFEKIPYDVQKDFTPITLLADGPYLLVVNPNVPVKNVAELIALAKAKPMELNYATSGNGSGAHLAAELLMSLTQIKMVHAPYKGGAQALSDVLAGHVQVLFTPPVSATQHIQSGKLRALAVTGSHRSAGLPNIPTLSEAGVPGYNSGVWYGVMAPAGTPKEVITRLNQAFIKVLKQPDFTALLVSSGIDPIGSSPEELTQFINKETLKWSKIIKAADIKVQ